MSSNKALSNLKTPKVAGTDPNYTANEILNSALDSLDGERSKLKQENEEYLNSHPEFQSLLDEFVSAVIIEKPSNIIKFSSEYFNTLRTGLNIGPMPLVIAGPSGVGKGTVIALLMKKFPTVFGFSVSHTTRDPRPGEENGVHYNFVTKADMEAGIAKGEFVEYAAVHTNFYGTSFVAVDKVKSEGKICILDIDIQGVQSVKRSSIPCKYIFIAPPSLEELETRLRGRGTETEEKIRVRLKNAAEELAYGNEPGNFDAIHVNNDLDSTVTEIIATLQSWYPDYGLSE